MSIYKDTFTPDPGEERANEEMLNRQREEKQEVETAQEEERILTEDLPRIRQEQDLEENPPLENLDWVAPDVKSDNILLKGLGYLGAGMDYVDKKVGIPGTDIDVYHARRSIIDPLEKTHWVLGMLGEFFIPDSTDLASGLALYVPKRFLKSANAVRKFVKAQRRTLPAEDVSKVLARYNDTALSPARGMRPDDFLGGGAPEHFESAWDSLNSALGVTPWLGKVIWRESTLVPKVRIGRGNKGRDAAARLQEGLDPKTRLGSTVKRWTKEGTESYDEILEQIPSLQREHLAAVIHHRAPLKLVAEALNGLNGEAVEHAAEYIIKRLRKVDALGFTQKGVPLPAKRKINIKGKKYSESPIHTRIHALMNESLGPNDNPLKYVYSTLDDAGNVVPKGKKLADMEVWERQEIFDAVIDTINDADNAIDTFYKNLKIRDRMNKFSHVSREEFIENSFDLAKFDKRFAQIKGRKPGKAGGEYVTIESIVNDITNRSNQALDNAINLVATSKNKKMTSPLYQLLLQERGVNILQAALEEGRTIGEIIKKNKIPIDERAFWKQLANANPRDFIDPDAMRTVYNVDMETINRYINSGWYFRADPPRRQGWHWETMPKNRKLEASKMDLNDIDNALRMGWDIDLDL